MNDWLENQIERLAQCDSKSEQKSLEVGIRQRLLALQEPNQRLQAKFRSAIMESNKTITRLLEENKEMLLRNRTKSSPATTFSTSKSITKNLQEAIEMADNHMNQGFAALSSLDESSKTVQRTSDKYHEMQDALNVSKRITTRMSKKDQIDRYIFYAGFTILFLTVLYIVWRRLWIPFL